MVNVILVDESDKELGLKEKYEAHKNPVQLHRAISVIIYSKDGKKMLLQKRAETKPTWPGFWSNATCTHPLPGESYMNAASRRLKEEMGFFTSLNEILKFTYQARYDKIWGENEYDMVFKGEYDGDVVINTDEAADYKWMDINDLYKDVESKPNSYTPWFKIILEKIK